MCVAGLGLLLLLLLDIKSALVAIVCPRLYRRGIPVGGGLT